MTSEVYVKKTMLFHGGTIFGKAVNNPAKLANTVLGIMIVCLYGGPTFLSKMLPVTNLSSQFIHEQISLTREAIQSSNGKIKVIICDDNRTNQKFFKTYNTLPNKPWLTNDDMFLLFDFVIKKHTKQLADRENGIARVRRQWYLKNCQLVNEYESGGTFFVEYLEKLNAIILIIYSSRPFNVVCEHQVFALRGSD